VLGFRTAVALASLLPLLADSPARAALLSLLGSSTLDLRVGQLGGERAAPYIGLGACFGQILYPSFPPIQFQMNQPVALVPLAPGGGFSEPAGLFTGTRTQSFPGLIQTVTPLGQFCSASRGVGLYDGVTVVQVSNATKSIGTGAVGGGHGAGVLRPGGGLGGPGPLAGAFLVNVLGLFNLEVPLAAVGSTGATGQAAAGTLQVTVLGTGWTTAPVQLTDLTTVTTQVSNPAFVNTVTLAGYDNRTPGHVGRVLLVSPFKVITNAAGNLQGIAQQTLDFGGVVPEPGALRLLALGALGLAIQGWRKRRR
jgi:hypothetical protein